jgi:hypothetical protein
MIQKGLQVMENRDIFNVNAFVLIANCCHIYPIHLAPIRMEKLTKTAISDNAYAVLLHLCVRFNSNPLRPPLEVMEKPLRSCAENLENSP